MLSIPLEKATRAEMLILLKHCTQGWSMSRRQLESILWELRVEALNKELAIVTEQLQTTSCHHAKYWKYSRKWTMLSNQLDSLLGVPKRKAK